MKIKVATLTFCVLSCLAGTLLAQTNLPLPTNILSQLPASARALLNSSGLGINLDSPPPNSSQPNAQGDYETQVRTGIVGDTNQTQDFALNPAFRIYGNISGGTPQSIAAIRDDGSVFTGVINRSTNNYAAVVTAGTFKLRACHGPAGPFGSTTATYDDPAPVIVTADIAANITADAQRDVMVQTLTTYPVSGLVTGGDPGSLILVLFSSQDQTSGGSAFSFGSYSANLVNGIYNVAVFQIDPATFAFSIFPVGTVTVSDSPVMMNFAIGNTGTLSGTVMKNIPIPANSTMTAVDSSATPGSGFNCVAPAPAAGIGPVDNNTGAYAMKLLTTPPMTAIPTSYSYSVYGSFPSLPADPPQSPGTWTLFDPVRVDFSGDMTRDEMFSVPTETIEISGQVTAAGGVGAEDIQQITNADIYACAPWSFCLIFGGFGVTGGGAPSSFFARGTRTDSQGNYRLVVPQGLTYGMVVSGPSPMP